MLLDRDRRVRVQQGRRRLVGVERPQNQGRIEQAVAVKIERRHFAGDRIVTAEIAGQSRLLELEGQLFEQQTAIDLLHKR